MIEVDADMDLGGEGADGHDALQLLRHHAPAVAVIDISMPKISGIDLVRRAAAECPEVRLLVLTVHDDVAYVRQVLEAGGAGDLLKRSAPPELLPASPAAATGA